MNYKIKIDASVFLEAEIIELPDYNRGGTRDCLVIPIDINPITINNHGKPIINLLMKEKAYCYGQTHYLSPMLNPKMYKEYKENGLLDRVRFVGYASPSKIYTRKNKYNIEGEARKCIEKILEEE